MLQMPNRAVAAMVLVSSLVTMGASAPAATSAPAAKSAPVAKPAPATTFEKATFAGGCFWCLETAFEGLPGVTAVISGYTDGAKLNPTYDEVSSGRTGHAESVQITYDPRRVTYAALLDLFWRNIDPTQANGQFCDIGAQYRSGIYYHDATQKRLAEESRRKLETTPQRFKKPIVTGITAATRFWPAEEYHQDYYKKDPERYESYRTGCGRDRRLTELWGQPGRHGKTS
jgi:peptide-methionine (S)-S-oxide reductase